MELCTPVLLRVSGGGEEEAPNPIQLDVQISAVPPEHAQGNAGGKE